MGPRRLARRRSLAPTAARRYSGGMFRVLLAAAAALAVGSAAHAQPVEVTPLAAPDAFSTPGRDTGLPRDLWKGASIDTLRTVLPLLAAKPLSPAAAQLAR